jgi:hypothetical protein
MHQRHDIRWVDASYTAIHHVLTNPVYAGAYAYGKTRSETVLDAAGGRRKRIRHLPRSDWLVLIPDHHPGFIDWPTYEANQARIAQNTRPGPRKEDGAVRKGSALLQGLARCGHCGRRLRTHYHGRLSSPGYHCPGKIIVEGRALLKPQRLNLRVASKSARVYSLRRSVVICFRSGPISPEFGTPQAPHHAIGRNCYERWLKRSPSKSSATKPLRIL